MNELHGKIAELKGELGAQYAADNRSIIEKSSLNKHMETLNESMVKYQRKLDAVEADNRRLMQVGVCGYIYRCMGIYVCMSICIYM